MTPKIQDPEGQCHQRDRTVRAKFLAALLILIAVVALVGLWPHFVTENQPEREVTSITVGEYSSSMLIAPT